MPYRPNIFSGPSVVNCGSVVVDSALSVVIIYPPHALREYVPSLLSSTATKHIFGNILAMPASASIVIGFKIFSAILKISLSLAILYVLLVIANISLGPKISMLLI